MPSVQTHIGSAWLFLPGGANQQLVNFATVNGQAVLEGDIMLGPATTLPFRYGVPWPASADSKSVTIQRDLNGDAINEQTETRVTNADGSKGRKVATYASGSLTITGLDDAVLDVGSQLVGYGTPAFSYETTGGDVTIGSGLSAMVAL